MSLTPEKNKVSQHLSFRMYTGALLHLYCDKKLK